MKKPLFSISRVHSNDVIATSASGSICSVNLDDYNFLFQCNGVNTFAWSVTNLNKGVKDGNYFSYTDGSFVHDGSKTEVPVYYNFDENAGTTDELEDGKWYHVSTSSFPDVVVECTNPESHHLVR